MYIHTCVHIIIYTYTNIILIYKKKKFIISKVRGGKWICPGVFGDPSNSRWFKTRTPKEKVHCFPWSDLFPSVHLGNYTTPDRVTLTSSVLKEFESRRQKRIEPTLRKKDYSGNRGHVWEEFEKNFRPGFRFEESRLDRDGIIDE